MEIFINKNDLKSRKGHDSDNFWTFDVHNVVDRSLNVAGDFEFSMIEKIPEIRKTSTTTCCRNHICLTVRTTVKDCHKNEKNEKTKKKQESSTE